MKPPYSQSWSSTAPDSPTHIRAWRRAEYRGAGSINVARNFVGKVQAWLDSNGRSPGQQAVKVRLREVLEARDARRGRINPSWSATATPGWRSLR
jgi:hypothetical protein